MTSGTKRKSMTEAVEKEGEPFLNELPDTSAGLSIVVNAATAGTHQNLDQSGMFTLLAAVEMESTVQHSNYSQDRHDFGAVSYSGNGTGLYSEAKPEANWLAYKGKSRSRVGNDFQVTNLPLPIVRSTIDIESDESDIEVAKE